MIIRDWKGHPVSAEQAPPGALIIRHQPCCPKCKSDDVRHTQVWLERYGGYHSKVWNCNVCSRVFLVDEPNDAPTAA